MEAEHVVIKRDAELTVAVEFRPHHSEMTEGLVNNCLLCDDAGIKAAFNKF